MTAWYWGSDEEQHFGNLTVQKSSSSFAFYSRQLLNTQARMSSKHCSETKHMKHYHLELSMLDHKRHTRPEKVTSDVNKELLYKDRICFTAGPICPSLFASCYCWGKYFAYLKNLRSSSKSYQCDVPGGCCSTHVQTWLSDRTTAI